jgi:hypothetical protein
MKKLERNYASSKDTACAENNFPADRLESDHHIGHCKHMSSVKEIESALARLPIEDLQAVRDWLDDFIEDQLEVSDEFKAKIARAKQEIADSVYSRKRKPEAG